MGFGTELLLGSSTSALPLPMVVALRRRRSRTGRYSYVIERQLLIKETDRRSVPRTKKFLFPYELVIYTTCLNQKIYLLFKEVGLS